MTQKYISVGTPGHRDYVEQSLKSDAEKEVAVVLGFVEKPIRVPDDAIPKMEVQILDPKQNDVWRKSHKRRFK